MYLALDIETGERAKMALPRELIELGQKVSNWGRWGADDRRGTLNLIDAVAVNRGLASARQGKVFSLAMPFNEEGPQLGFIPGRINPKRTMIQIDESLTGDKSDFTTSDDAVEMGVQSATHWDALAHVSYNGLLYNGVPSASITDAGSADLGIDNYGAIATRGVLLDVARALGAEMLPDGYAITGDDLDIAARHAGVTVAPGDIICIRTGWMHWLRVNEKLHYSFPTPGPSPKSIEWFRDHDVAGVATDTLVFENYPAEDPAANLAVHMIHLRDIGLAQGQNWALDELAADCLADGQYDFLLTATPIPFTHAVGGPVAPTAIK